MAGGAGYSKRGNNPYIKHGRWHKFLKTACASERLWNIMAQGTLHTMDPPQGPQLPSCAIMATCRGPHWTRYNQCLARPKPHSTSHTARHTKQTTPHTTHCLPITPPCARGHARTAPAAAAADSLVGSAGCVVHDRSNPPKNYTTLIPVIKLVNIKNKHVKPPRNACARGVKVSFSEPKT